MGNPEALLRSAALVEERLKDPVTVQEMAEAACWSLYHFCRVFSEALGMGPYDYLVRRRVTEAARDLDASERRITDLAFGYQFGSPEVFSRCFKRALGVLPSKLREGEVHARFLPPLTRELAEYITSRASRPRVCRVEFPSIRLRGLATLLEIDAGARLAEIDVCLSLGRLRRATALAPGDLPRSPLAVYAILEPVGPGFASLFLGSPALPGVEAQPAALEISLPGGTYLRSAAETAVPLSILRSHFHSLWYPAASDRRAGEREIYRWTGATSGAGESGVELLVPVDAGS